MSSNIRIYETEAAVILRSFHIPPRLIDFGKALEAANGGLDWPYFLEKPWKWTSEYVTWQNLDTPFEGDATWTQFVEALQ